MRTPNGDKREVLYSPLCNNWSVLFEITVNMLLNDDPTRLALEVRGKPLTSRTKGWENTTLSTE